LAGLKNWEQGDLVEAARFFNAVNSANLGQQDSWVLIYQKLASEYLTDFKAFSSPLFDHPPKGKAACEEAIAELNALLPKIKTRGRARFNVAAWKLDLERLARLHEPTKPTDKADSSDPSGKTDKSE